MTCASAKAGACLASLCCPGRALGSALTQLSNNSRFPDITSLQSKCLDLATVYYRFLKDNCFENVNGALPLWNDSYHMYLHNSALTRCSDIRVQHYFRF